MTSSDIEKSLELIRKTVSDNVGNNPDLYASVDYHPQLLAVRKVSVLVSHEGLDLPRENSQDILTAEVLPTALTIASKLVGLGYSVSPQANFSTSTEAGYIRLRCSLMPDFAKVDVAPVMASSAMAVARPDDVFAQFEHPVAMPLNSAGQPQGQSPQPVWAGGAR